MPIPLDPLARDPSILRSVLYFPDRFNCFFGAEAIQEFVKHDMEGRFFRSVKKFLPIRSFVNTQIGNRVISLEEIISVFLGEMRKRANKHFQRDVDSVLLGRPARFSSSDEDDAFAQARLEKAANLAGFKHVEFCPEPIAAAYEFKSKVDKEKIVLVSDFGGGTSDFTVIRIGPAKYKPSDVLSIGGISLAGDALDGAMMRRRISKYFGADVQYKAPFGSNILTMPLQLMEKICSPADISMLRQRDTMDFFRNVQGWSLGSQDKVNMDRLFNLINEQIGFELFEEIERVKRSLSTHDSETFSFHKSGVEIDDLITQKEFVAITEETIRSIFASLDKTVEAAQIKYEDIDLVYSTGGTAKVAAIQKGLVDRFGMAKVQEQNHFHSIVHGLIRMAADMGMN